MTMRNEEQVDARSVRQELVDSTRSLRHLEASWHVEDDPNRPGLCIAVLSQRVRRVKPANVAHCMKHGNEVSRAKQSKGAQVF